MPSQNTGHGPADEGHDGDGVAERAVQPARGQRAEQRPRHDREDQRREHKQNRGPHPAQNKVENGLVEEIAVAEIAVRDLADVNQQLLGDALVELEAVPQLEHELLIHSAHLPGDGLHDVAGGEPDEREVEHDDREQEERGVQDASADQGERLHGVTSGCRGPRRGGIRRGVGVGEGNYLKDTVSIGDSGPQMLVTTFWSRLS